MAPTLELTYFDTKGRAEPIRLALYIGGIQFEDKRVTGEQFASLKPSLPYGQLPVLEVDGEVISQGLAQLRYAGKLSGLYPEDPVAALRVDEALGAGEDMSATLWPSFVESDQAKKLEMRKALAEEALPKWFGVMEKRYSGRHGDYSCGKELTVADLALYSFGAWIRSGALDGIPANSLDPYPTLCGIIEKVGAHPKVKEWNDKH
ncbi:unnamed protein product [Ostreobium quekettii]|uniref:Glutathione S-transferase n=1 Tax=Ostreobium quekettii TaxID=121088 RepID=A0A8S1J2Q8_9CHLO|nr:unnamed protein product [Ostreobium quekettii]|eukprot:evm.model.scf_18.7 EVM.evm.TU.scf_18.7   scf_18:33670-34561(-)